MTKQQIDLEAVKSAGLDSEALARLDASIQSDIDKGNNFGASIIVARGGVIGHRRSFGTVAPERQAAEDDIYLAMSVSKSFTAALILQAIDHGRFSFDTRVADILPAFAAGGKQRVTVRQLLNHTAGVFAGIIPPPSVSPAEYGDLAKTVGAICPLPAMYTPGTRCSYTQSLGYSLLGQILVETDPAKRAFGDIACDDLFAPLGMADTRFGLAADNPRRVSVSYTEKLTAPSSAINQQFLNAAHEGTEFPGWGAYTTVEDTFRFADALRRRGDNGSYRLMSQAMFDYAVQNSTGDMSNGAWDFAREAGGLPDYPANFSLLGGYVRGMGHNVSGAGFTASPGAFYALGGGSTLWMVDPARDLTFVFLSAGFIEGLEHFQRLCRLSDLALAACVD